VSLRRVAHLVEVSGSCRLRWMAWPQRLPQNTRRIQRHSLGTDVAACLLIHITTAAPRAANLLAYSLLTGPGAARMVGEVGNSPNKCNWVENSITDARHVGRWHSRDVSAQYIEI
jgi:hypothetical protein